MGLTEELPSWIRKYFKPDNTNNYGEVQKYLRFTTGAKYRERIKLNPASVKVPGTKAASWVDHGIGGAWGFSDATDDTIVGTFEQPTNIESLIEIRLLWSSAATSGNCVWQIEYLYISSGEDTSAAAQETLSTTVSVDGTANALVETGFGSIANPVNSDKYLIFRLKRLGADGSDTISNTVELSGLTYEYVADRLGGDV